ncbi:MAG: helix-turn-helix transcriptional regulator [Actinomycetota bacterium]
MLPVGVAAFVGRAQERATVGDLVADARVVTLTGSGGCGKTRLAVELAGGLASGFSDGACWVDLQGLSEPGLVAAAVGAAVGAHERSGQALVDTLAEQLRARHLLVILDNCEHVVEACAELVNELTHTCPRLHILATSRKPLAVAGEATFEVAPLPVPDPDARSASTIAAADAARLFEVRARQARTDFRIDDDNASAVAEICRRLDGIPLAIELAAARVRVLAPDQIAAGLSNRFGLLTGGVRGAPARQQTLEASLDWSYGLLDVAQRLALARLSVFAGSFELDAAEAVVAGDGIDDSVLDLIAGLAEQSLVQVAERDGRARYRLLETIRVYARQRLPGLDDPDRVRGRHLDFYVDLAGRAHAGLTGAQPESWVARLTAELDDLRAAMDWAAQAGDLRGLVGLTEPIVRFWFDRGLSREVHRRLHDATDTPGTPDAERVRGLTTAAPLALAVGEPARAYRSASNAVDALSATEPGGLRALAYGLRAWSGALSGLSTSEQLDADVDEAVQLAQQCEDASTHAYALTFAGAALGHSRSIDAGCRLLEETIKVCETNDLAFQLPAAHAALGAGLGPGPEWSGRLDETRRHAHRAVELSRQVGRPGWELAGLTGLGAAAVLEGDHSQARDLLSQAAEVVRQRGLAGSHYDLAFRHWVAFSAYATGDLETAQAVAERIVRTGRGGGNRWDEAIGEWLLGMLAHGEGRHDDARAHLQASRALSTDPRLPWPLGRSLLGLAELAERDEHLDEAWELAHDGLEILDDYGDRIGTAAALETIADLVALGEPERSLRLLAASQRFHADTGIARFPLETQRFDHARDTAHAGLGPSDATACWDAGTELSLADAVAYARRGRGERRRPQIGWASLTPTERDVVDLVTKGHTNAEIGERLFMSVNTVKKHLTRVYAKVDVDGRADLAAGAASRGVKGPRDRRAYPVG